MTETNRMSLDDLRKTREYMRLTPKQKMFVDTYCGAGILDGNYDAVTATHTAYQCKSEEVARIMSYTLLANIKIVAVLNRHFGSDPIDSFLATLDRAIRNKNLTMPQLGALRLQCEVLGLGTKIPKFDQVVDFPNTHKKEKKSKKPTKTVEPPPQPARPGYDPSQFE